MSFEALSQRLGGHLSRWLVAAILLPPVVYSMWADEYLFFFFLIFSFRHPEHFFGFLCFFPGFY
jgi:hypothetical protein